WKSTLTASSPAPVTASIPASSKASTTASRSSSAWPTATATPTTSSSRSEPRSPVKREEPFSLSAAGGTEGVEPPYCLRGRRFAPPGPGPRPEGSGVRAGRSGAPAIPALTLPGAPQESPSRNREPFSFPGSRRSSAQTFPFVSGLPDNPVVVANNYQHDDIRAAGFPSFRPGSAARSRLPGGRYGRGAGGGAL